ncbi:MAG: VTT domain-containing protein [Deltaproteobacteria bacterium]|nr:VTT domain-containing protein [Deltaproteobacteria bacterium]
MGELVVYIRIYGGIAIFAASLIENLGVPFPAYPLIILAAAFAASGILSLPGIIAAAVLGAIGGDIAWYYLGRHRGVGVLSHLCRVSFNPDACLERAVDGFHRRKVATILFAKFLPGVNLIMPPLAGVSKMPILAFLALDGAGATLWAGSAAALGWTFGEEIAESARGIQGWTGWILLAGIGASLAWRLGFRYYLVHAFSAPRVMPEEVHRRLASGDDLLVVDLRRDNDYASSDSMIAGALRVRPASFHRFAHHLPRDRDIVFYCT